MKYKNDKSLLACKIGQGERTTLTGVEIGVDVTEAEKIWTLLSAIGDIAFACSYSAILIEIQVSL